MYNKNKQPKECWDNLVLEYDPKNSLKKFWCKPGVWADEIAQRLSDCEKILDVGSGSGALSIPLSKKFDISCLDFSSNMLLQLKNRKEELKTELKIIEADAHYIPFKDETFDAVISRNAIWPLSDPQHAIEEMVRVSRKKIVIIEGDWDKNGEITLRQKIFGKMFYKIYNSYYKIRTGTDPKVHFKEIEKYHRTSSEKIKKWLENCGIIIREVDYSIKDHVSTRKAKLTQMITGYNEDIFVIVGEKHEQ